MQEVFLMMVMRIINWMVESTGFRLKMKKLKLRWVVYPSHIRCSTEWQRRFLVQPGSTCCLRHHLQTSPYHFPYCLSDTYTKGDGSVGLRSRTAAAMWQTNTIYL